jgi:hypothetical protein
VTYLIYLQVSKQLVLEDAPVASAATVSSDSSLALEDSVESREVTDPAALAALTSAGASPVTTNSVPPDSSC